MLNKSLWNKDHLYTIPRIVHSFGPNWTVDKLPISLKKYQYIDNKLSVVYGAH